MAFLEVSSCYIFLGSITNTYGFGYIYPQITEMLSFNKLCFKQIVLFPHGKRLILNFFFQNQKMTLRRAFIFIYLSFIREKQFLNQLYLIWQAYQPLLLLNKLDKHHKMILGKHLLHSH